MFLIQKVFVAIIRGLLIPPDVSLSKVLFQAQLFKGHCKSGRVGFSLGYTQGKGWFQFRMPTDYGYRG